MEKNTTKVKRILVIGGSRGFGAAISQHCLQAGHQVYCLSRTLPGNTDFQQNRSLKRFVGDARDRELAQQLLLECSPQVVIINAGVIGAVKPITEQSWGEFSATWNTDVQSTLVWCQEIVKQPLMASCHVIIMSSGSAKGGSPLTGGYAGAKRTQRMMGNIFRQECKLLGLDIKITVVLPQLTGDTDLSRPAAEAYGERAGISAAEFVHKIGKPFTSHMLGHSVLRLIDEHQFHHIDTVAINGEGIHKVE